MAQAKLPACATISHVNSRERIIGEIKRTAEDGKPLGRARFVGETGIGVGECERYWPRWSDALREAGFEPNALNARLSDDVILAPLVDEIRRLGRLPSSRELAIRRRDGAPVASPTVYQRRYGSRAELARRVVAYCPDVAELVGPLLVEPPVERETDHPVAIGDVYLIKSGRHYKIGRSNAAGRRERELAIQLPERATRVHTIKTDDPPGIERYWHRRFADKRVRPDAEWFSLTPADVRAFKRYKFM